MFIVVPRPKSSIAIGRRTGGGSERRNCTIGSTAARSTGESPMSAPTTIPSVAAMRKPATKRPRLGRGVSVNLLPSSSVRIVSTIVCSDGK